MRLVFFKMFKINLDSKNTIKLQQNIFGIWIGSGKFSLLPREYSESTTSWNPVISPNFQMNGPKLCGNCVFPQNFHTRKLGEITAFTLSAVNVLKGHATDATDATTSSIYILFKVKFISWKFCTLTFTNLQNHDHSRSLNFW